MRLSNKTLLRASIFLAGALALGISASITARAVNQNKGLVQFSGKTQSIQITSKNNSQTSWTLEDYGVSERISFNKGKMVEVTTPNETNTIDIALYNCSIENDEIVEDSCTYIDTNTITCDGHMPGKTITLPVKGIVVIGEEHTENNFLPAHKGNISLLGRHTWPLWIDFTDSDNKKVSHYQSKAFETEFGDEVRLGNNSLTFGYINIECGKNLNADMTVSLSNGEPVSRIRRMGLAPNNFVSITNGFLSRIINDSGLSLLWTICLLFLGFLRILLVMTGLQL